MVSIHTETIRNLLTQIGVDPNHDNLQQFNVLLSAFKIYNDRSKLYNQTWKQYGALNNLVRGATKIDRLMNVFWHRNDIEWHKDVMDDAYDAINYVTFFIRLIEDGNVLGNMPKRPQV